MQAVGMASRRIEGMDADVEGSAEVWMSENAKWALIWLGGLASWAWLAPPFVFMLDTDEENPS
jgi:hypothetical protein